jgi:hypothetical protein
MKNNPAVKESMLKGILLRETEKPGKCDLDRRLWKFNHTIGGHEIKGLKIMTRTKERTFNF